MYNTVENNLFLESVPDDAAQARESEVTLNDLMTQQTEAKPAKDATADAPATPPVQQQSEPGWIKGRVNAAVEREVARVRSEYEAQLAPLREAVMGSEADRLVSEGEFKSRERAIEYLRLKNGMPVTAESPAVTPQRDDKGRYAAKAEAGSDDARQRGQMLFNQAKTIERLTGVNMLEAFKTNETVKQKVLSGEWDFADAAEALKEAPRARAPYPSRSANGSDVASAGIMRMSGEEFKKLNEYLAGGGVLDVNR